MGLVQPTNVWPVNGVIALAAAGVPVADLLEAVDMVGFEAELLQELKEADFHWFLHRFSEVFFHSCSMGFRVFVLWFFYGFA